MTARAFHPWLASRRYDLAFFTLSCLLALALVPVYRVFGDAAIPPVYATYLFAFSLPHHALTWSSVLPRGARGELRWMPLAIALVASLAISASYFALGSGAAREWLLVGIYLLSVWHLYRQHHGICKVYDAVQARRSGDASVFADRLPMNVLLALGCTAMTTWLFTHERLEYALDAGEYEQSRSLALPAWVFHVHLALLALAAIWTLERSVLARVRRRVFVPWPQLALTLGAIAGMNAPMVLMPLSALQIAIAGGSIHHAVQYFGFVWLFERRRTPALARRTNGTLGLPQRLALSNHWGRYALLALAYPLAVWALGRSAPLYVALAVGFFSNVSHTIVDGVIWRRGWNRSIGTAVESLAANPT